MKPPRSLPVVGTCIALLASTLVLASSTAALPRAEAQETCTADGASLDDARAAYAENCSAPRVDCDPTESGWTCSSDIIGDAAPGGVSAPEPSPSPVTPEPTAVALTPEPETEPEPVPSTPTPSIPTPSIPTPGPVADDPNPGSPPAPTVEPTERPTTTATENVPDQTDTPPTVEPGTEPAADAPVPTTSSDAGATPPQTDDAPAGETGPLIASGDSVIERTYPVTEGPNDNPMKGWNSGWWQDRPESTVGFQYIRWSDLEPQNGEFDFEAVEDIIDRPGSRDRHVTLRLYCDWYGEHAASDGCPDWIYSEIGVDRIHGDNGRYITDYNDPRYIDEAIDAINALGARYDNDPRVYTIQLGLLGYWGEWHTFGSQVDGSPYEIDELSASRILDAYLQAFDRVQIVGRYPYRTVLADTSHVGFHNDYFRPNNGHSADFDQSVAAGSRWLDGPIGGEVPPGLSSVDYEDLYATPQGASMIDVGHYSTMKPGEVDERYGEEHLRLHRRLGYTYRIETAQFSASQPTGGQTNVAVALRNTGVAPFYYDWDVEFGLLDEDGAIVSVSESSFDLRTAMPGDSFNVSAALSLDTVAGGSYRLAMRIVQPGADEPKPSAWGLDPRNTYILFANEMPVITGQWDDTNALIGGWSVLGETSVE